MIRSITRGTEIGVLVVNEVGALAKMASFLVNHGINIEAIVGYSSNVGDQGELVFVTDNNRAAIKELLTCGYNNIREGDIIIVELENRPGALKNISELLSANGININYFYSTACSRGCPAKVVLSTTDNDRAVSILKA